ncbi:MAG TPA: FAD-dependent oxidoreductase [Pyrinomonadaceae bacterium]|nr:FAD-dependent oxidoreductase [Pyrinomonadaceae bacterium]
MFTADVVIVGGGPAGAATALALARRGLSAIVLEAHSAPQMKVGECLPPSINPLLDHFGLTERLRRRGNLPSYGNRFAWGSDSVQERDFIFGPAGAGWRVDRSVFEEELMQAAAEAGARWHYDQRLVACSREKEKGFELTVRGLDGVETYRSDFVVDATGRAARLAGSLGARRVIYDRLIGVAAFFDGKVSSEEDSFTLVEAASSGWWYSSRLPGGKLIAVYMTDGDLLDHTALRETGGWLGLLNKSDYTAQRVRKYGSGDPTTPRILPAHTVRLTSVAGDGWLAVGDSAVAFDPLASHGIAMAMGSGFNAASSIVDYLRGRREALRDYERLIDRAFAHYLVMHHDAYRHEQRWPHESFWHRRHAPRFETMPRQHSTKRGSVPARH